MYIVGNRLKSCVVRVISIIKVFHPHFLAYICSFNFQHMYMFYMW